VQNWTPQQTAEALDAGEIILVDVREAAEYHEARIPGALLLPLSTFDPAALPTGQGRKVVLHCKAGGRSATAIEHCQALGIDVDAHVAGGIGDWIAAGLPYFRLDLATGQMVREG
jgi:rhodanese-related sulfurtransferase